MPQKITTGFMKLVNDAKSQVQEYEAADAVKLHGDPNVS